MEDSSKNIELIDKFIDNERKSKMWTIISVCLFLLMATIVLLFSKRLSETKIKLTISEDSLHKVNARLYFLNDSIQKAKDSVDLVNIGLELKTDKNANWIDSLEDVNDTLTVLLNTSHMGSVLNTVEATQKVSNLFEQAFPGPGGNPSDKIAKSIIKTKIIKEEKKPLSISVLYMNMKKYTDLSNDINKLLDSRNLKVERMEPVSGTTFNPTVKYFRKEDEKIADEIAKVLNEFYKSQFKQPFIPQLINLKSPANHVEIWIGQYEKPKYLNLLPIQTLDQKKNL